MKRAAQIVNGMVANVVVVPAEAEDPAAYMAALIGGSWVTLSDRAGTGWGWQAGGGVAPVWFQIFGAGGGPPGAEDGFPLGSRVWWDGRIWISRNLQPNVDDPIAADLGQPTTWSREDGRFVVPAGWQYQPGEDLTGDDGATWWRVVQATSFSPADFPAAYVQIDGPGGEPLATPAWVAPTGAHDAYAEGAVVTHDGQTWTSTTADNIWEPGVFGWVAA